MNVWGLCYLAAVAVEMAWAVAGIGLLTIDRTVKPCRVIYQELRPFYRPAMGLEAISAIGLGFGAGSIVNSLGAETMLWFILRNLDKDDRWQRRRRRAVSVVKSLQGRLIVVPALEPAR